jgi:6-phosphogluconolactonase
MGIKAPFFHVCSNLELLATKAASFVQECAREAIHERGRFTLVLSGGTTPEQTYEFLAHHDRNSSIGWSKTFIFFGDERFVPHSDIRSNYAMVRRCLLNDAPIPPSHVFPIATNVASAADAAVKYAEQLANFFQVPLNGEPPAFDLILLGLGHDGHTASLFPNSPVLNMDQVWVATSLPVVSKPLVDRITFTYPLLNAARHVAFLVSGERKAATLHQLFEEHATRDVCPAAGVQPTHGSLTWFVDAAAAKQVKHWQTAQEHGTG